MEKIPTAEELLSKRVYINRDGVDSVDDTVSDVTATMVEFAKMHVEAALKEASEKAKIKTDYWTDLGGGEHEESTINKNSIKKSYSLDNIK
jgi:hypothetical protein